MRSGRKFARSHVILWWFCSFLAILSHANLVSQLGFLHDLLFCFPFDEFLDSSLSSFLGRRSIDGFCLSRAPALDCEARRVNHPNLDFKFEGPPRGNHYHATWTNLRASDCVFHSRTFEYIGLSMWYLELWIVGGTIAHLNAAVTQSVLCTIPTITSPAISQDHASM